MTRENKFFTQKCSSFNPPKAIWNLVTPVVTSRSVRPGFFNLSGHTMVCVPVRRLGAGTTWSETVQNGNERQRRSGAIYYFFSLISADGSCEQWNGPFKRPSGSRKWPNRPCKRANGRSNSQMHSVNGRMDLVSNQMDGKNSQMDCVSSQMNHVNSQMNSLNSRMNCVNSKVDCVNSQVETAKWIL